MLKKLLKNKKFSRKIKSILKEEKVLDLILFGSAVRGKEKPKDIDLLILYVPGIEDITEKNYEIKNKLKEINYKFEVTGKTYDDLFSSEFFAREGILSGGFSLKQKKFISECYGYKGFTFFKYSLNKLNKSKRMQFYYALNGRGKNKGLLKKKNSYKLSNNIILAPIKNSQIMKDFLENWNIEYTEFPITIPERIVKYKIDKNDL